MATTAPNVTSMFKAGREGIRVQPTTSDHLIMKVKALLNAIPAHLPLTFIDQIQVIKPPIAARELKIKKSDLNVRLKSFVIHPLGLHILMPTTKSKRGKTRGMDSRKQMPLYDTES